MEDVVTDIPPPSRFFYDELNNFASPSPSPPSPFLVMANPLLHDSPLRPSLLVIAISHPSLYISHHISSKTLLGSLILPEIPISGNSLTPSLRDSSCNIYDIDSDSSTMLILVQYNVIAERARAVTRVLIGEHIVPERVLILDSIQIGNFRGSSSMPPDEAFMLKLETTMERCSEDGISSIFMKGVSYFPSGSIVDGLSAALLERCEIKGIRGTLCMSWPPHYGSSAIPLVRSLFLDHGLPVSSLDEVVDWVRGGTSRPLEHGLYT